MTGADHLDILNGGVDSWNAWRLANPGIQPHLVNAVLIGRNLIGCNLQGADLTGANLIDATLSGANLNGATFDYANLAGAHFNGQDVGDTPIKPAYCKGSHFTRASLHAADFAGADLTWATFHDADLGDTILNGANLQHANLTRARMVETKLTDADLSHCEVYGVSVWNIDTSPGTKQTQLRISHESEPTLTVDNIEVAQFIYLITRNEKIREVLNTVTTKAVLLLGRFTTERLAVLDDLWIALRTRDYLPILFNFDEPATRTMIETVTTLARLAKFIIADITDPKSVPQELQAIVEGVPLLPVQPIIAKGARPWGGFRSIQAYTSVLPLYEYQDRAALLAALDAQILHPLEAKVKASPPPV